MNLGIWWTLYQNKSAKGAGLYPPTEPRIRIEHTQVDVTKL